jgi:hypothetical protein
MMMMMMIVDGQGLPRDHSDLDIGHLPTRR